MCRMLVMVLEKLYGDITLLSCRWRLLLRVQSTCGVPAQAPSRRYALSLMCVFRLPCITFFLFTLHRKTSCFTASAINFGRSSRSGTNAIEVHAQPVSLLLPEDWPPPLLLVQCLKVHVHMQLMECPAEDDYITSVAWAADGKHVSVGTSSAQVQVNSDEASHLLHTFL